MSGHVALVETAHFRVLGACVEARPRLHLDNDLADVIVAELAPLGLIPDLAAFERLFVRTVEGSAPTPGLAWNSFYRNTLLRLRALANSSGEGGSVATFARIYAQAARLVTGSSVLDIGCCFGFLPILLAEQRPDVLVLGCDLSAGTVGLAGRVARGVGSGAHFFAADAVRLPLPDRAMHTITVVHVLEHVSSSTGDDVLAEALRVADQRVVVAVPLEYEPNPAYGHLRTFTARELRALGLATGWLYTAWVSDGGWLLLDRP
jgi:SAM-dependent methyltransferase